MKRTKAFFLTILAVMGLCSCGESTEVKPVKLAEDYKTPAEFTIDGTEDNCAGNCKRHGDNLLRRKRTN